MWITGMLMRLYKWWYIKKTKQKCKIIQTAGKNVSNKNTNIGKHFCYM